MTTSAASYRCCSECFKQVRVAYLPKHAEDSYFAVFTAIFGIILGAIVTAKLCLGTDIVYKHPPVDLLLRGTCTIGRDGACERYLPVPALNCAVYLGGEEIPKSHVDTSTFLKIKDVYYSAGREAIYECSNAPAEPAPNGSMCAERGGILVKKCLHGVYLHQCPDAWTYWKCEDQAK